VNAADDLPATTVAEAGAEAEVELLESFTTRPPVGAGPVSVTVPAEESPPETEAGFSPTDCNEAVAIVKVADWVAEPSFAVIVAVFWVVEALVATVKLADDWPDAIATVAGTLADGSLLVSETVSPPAPASPLSDTVPVEDRPPTSVVGLRMTDVKTAGEIVSVADWEVPLRLALIAVDDWAFTPTVATVNVPVFWPASTVTVAGTLAEGLLLDKATVVPPVPAGPLRVAVPVDGLPPTTEAGFRLRETRVDAAMVSVAD